MQICSFWVCQRDNLFNNADAAQNVQAFPGYNMFNGNVQQGYTQK
jgi:hypothetical protein